MASYETLDWGPSRTGPGRAEAIHGDMDERTSLNVAFRGPYDVFSVQPTTAYPGTSPGFTHRGRVTFDRNAADAAADACTEHFTYASVGHHRHSPAWRHRSRYVAETSAHLRARVSAGPC
ncbi:NmrA family NAD(P)-binding protein [Nonomuraea jabiensis]|uniref:NmrA family NAD(P)-binding protein n=1 Tax=Nonomuraea jabiensis TaxID=882448 RepID=UPI0036B3C74D